MNAFFKSLAGLFAPVVAAACPVCFSTLGGIGTALGLGFFPEGQSIIFFQFLIVLSIGFAALSYQRTRFLPTLLLTLMGGTLIFVGLYVWGGQWLGYLGMIGIAIAAVWNFILEYRQKKRSYQV